MSSEHAVTFILTNSHDVTSDLLVSKIGTQRIFRFNFNLWQEYKIKLTDSGFEIENPVGRKVSDYEVAKCYWRKPMSWQRMTPGIQVSERVAYVEEELWYMMREILNLMWLQERVVLVEPFADLRCGKVIQARAARRYFNVPRFKCVFGSSDYFRSGQRSVVKSLSSRRVDKTSFFYTTAVEEGELDPAAPWMVQDMIVAEHDVTIVFVRNRHFSFSLARQPFVERTLDWREVGTEYVTDDWLEHPLPPEIEHGVFALMADLGLQYGRIDMLLAGGVYYFLEVNPNGEWGWLDASGKYGLLEKIINEISPETACHPLPVTRSLGTSQA